MEAGHSVNNDLINSTHDIKKSDTSGESNGNSATLSVCGSPGCGKPAELACPTCIKLGITPTRFCTQECFKESWNDHKILHKQVKKAKATDDVSSMPPEFKGFAFTGSLRPYQKTPRRLVPHEIERPDYADHPQGIPLSEQRDRRENTTIKVYNAEEIAGIREACRIGREVLDAGGRVVRIGVTCDEIDRVIHEATIERGAYPSPLNYHMFPKSVCTSVNEVICHGIPDLRELQDGDIVNIDVSVYYKGYHADLNETFFVGSPDADSMRLVKCAYESLAAAIDIVRPGTLYKDCGEAIGRVAKEAGCSVVTTYCGHGIGKLFHTAPNIPHYPNNKAKGTMKAGHIFTIEPMINLGHFKDKLWPDNWTAVTIDGTRSSQFEHTMLVTDTGVELLTARAGDPSDKIIWDPNVWKR